MTTETTFKPGPRVTPEEVDANIADIRFFTAAQGAFGADMYRDGTTPMPAPSPLDLLTFCVLTLKNGYTVHGISACAAPEIFDAEIGKDFALKDAKSKCWPLLGFRLRDRLSAEAHFGSQPSYPETGSLI